MEEAAIIEQLTLFGLSRQEAAIYLCLLKNEELTGYEVAKLTGISTPVNSSFFRRHRYIAASCLLSPNRVSCSMIAASSMSPPLVVLYRNTIVRNSCFVNRGNDY